MNITNLPKSEVFYKDNAVRIFMNQLVNQLQEFLSDDRYKLPKQNNDSISVLNNPEPSKADKNIGSILYNSDAKTVEVNTDGTYKKLATYEELTSAEVIAITSGEKNGRFIFETDTGDLRIGVNNLFKTVTLI